MSNRYQNAPPTKEGELLKYKNLWSGWETRYFKLERTYLHYYESKHAPSPKDTVLRTLIVNVKPSAAFPDKQLVFEIQHKSGTVWYCQATSMQEMVEWMSVLSNTPLFVDTQQYPITYPQPAGVDPVPVANNGGPLPSAPLVADHHHVLYPCLHQDFSEPTTSQHNTAPPSYSEATAGQGMMPQR